MKLMGLIDSGPESATEFTAEPQWECPLEGTVIERMVTASGHLFFPKIQKEGRNDDYVLEDDLRNVVGVAAESVSQCDCPAHRYLCECTSEAECEDIKTLIRSSDCLTADSGSAYACALLRLMFTSMMFKPIKSGQDYGVSYVLLC